MMKYISITALLSTILVSIFSCTKNASDTGGGTGTAYKFSYADSIIYLKPSAGDYIVSPVTAAPGTYTGFPDGIQIDENTGAINVSKSETGLRYRITRTAPDGTTSGTMVVLSGITFTDHYFHLSKGDTIAMPVYNASITRALPVAGSSFDEGNVANSGGCDIKTTNGQINLLQTIRNGIFGSTPQNDVRKDFDIEYRLNDGSGKSLNKLRVRLYYYNTMADVPSDLLTTLQDREDLGVFLRTPQGLGNIDPITNRVAKPRPPCIILVAQ